MRKRITAVVSAVVTVACLHAAQSAPPRFDGARAYEDIRQLVAIGPRPAGSPAIQLTRDYIKKQLIAAGLTPDEQPFDAKTPIGTIHMINVRATLPGPGQAADDWSSVDTTTPSCPPTFRSSARAMGARAPRSCWSWRAP